MTTILDAIALEIEPLVGAEIKVERVGFTRNASNTPYIVYRVKDHRWSTFIARSRFLELVQVLLKLKWKIEDRISTVASSSDFGLSVKAGECQRYIPSGYLNRFFERYNKVAFLKINPQESCDCNDLYDMCLHQIALALQPRLEKMTEPMQQQKPLGKYNLYARGTKACAKNWEILQRMRRGA